MKVSAGYLQRWSRKGTKSEWYVSAGHPEMLKTESKVKVSACYPKRSKLESRETMSAGYPERSKMESKLNGLSCMAKNRTKGDYVSGLS